MICPRWFAISLVFKVVLMDLGAWACTKDAKEIGVCLHTYLERDFPSVSMVVYPQTQSGTDCSRGGPIESKKLEGPQVASHCKQIKLVLDCFETVLRKCKYMEDFFVYRELLESLDKTFDWVCGDVKNQRERLGSLLVNFECIEKLVFDRHCKIAGIEKNVWNKILRLEMDNKVCSKLKDQNKCVMDSNMLARYSNEAHYVYGNMSSIFLSGRWCRS